jgi:glycosyltransferase involved in cell wall biosynthesis
MKTLSANTVVLTNFIAPYRLPLFRVLQNRLSRFKILISTPMEPNRSWHPEWEGLPVVVQRNLTFHGTWRHPRGFSEPLYIHVPYDTLWLLWRLRPEVIISNEMGLRTLQAAMYRRLLNSQSKLIIWATLSEHTEQGRGRVRESLRRWLLHEADAVLVNGESGARYIRRFEVASERIFRAPYPTDVASFAAAHSAKSPDKGVQRLLYVGQLIERKGLRPFLETLTHWAAKHPQRELEFWLMGDGPLRPFLESAPAASNLRLRFLGSLPYDRLHELYAQTDVLAFPTMADEWGMVVNEAMAVGLPVLGSFYSQAVEELVEDEVNGWTFRPNHDEETFEALDRALRTSPEVLGSMGRAARSKALRLTPDAVADRFMAAISYCYKPSS